MLSHEDESLLLLRNHKELTFIIWIERYCKLRMEDFPGCFVWFCLGEYLLIQIILFNLHISKWVILVVLLLLEWWISRCRGSMILWSSHRTF